MHEGRLKQLRRVVEAAPDDRLHMARWCDPAARCGTAYCAAGWAAVDPWFRANTEIGDIFTVDDDGMIDLVSRVRTGSALAHLFDIGDSVAFRLFVSIPAGHDVHRVTKAMVLANIDRVLAGQPVLYYGDMTKKGKPHSVTR